VNVRELVQDISIFEKQFYFQKVFYFVIHFSKKKVKSLIFSS
jgi:hypothetical protein